MHFCMPDWMDGWIQPWVQVSLDETTSVFLGFGFQVVGLKSIEFMV